MSRPFAAVESFLERILERPAARLFHAHPQPVQLERRIERAMSAMKVVAAGQTYVPSRYRIMLNPADLEALHATDEDLAALLADAILVRARQQDQWLLGRPDVALVASSRIAQGDLEVDAEPLDPSLVAAAATGLRPVELEGPKPPRAPIPGTGLIDDEAVARAGAKGWEPMLAPPIVEASPSLAAAPVVAEAHAPPPVLPMAAAAPVAAQVAVPTPAVPPVAASVPAAPPAPPAVAPVAAPAAAPVVAARPPDPEPLIVPPPLLPPPLVGPQAIIEVRLPDGTLKEVAFDGSVLSVGRGTDNDIVVPDERVSRHHGRFSARHGTLVYTDLGSTNGSQVGGVRVREVALGAGDVVRVGRASLTVRPRP